MSSPSWRLFLILWVNSKKHMREANWCGHLEKWSVWCWPKGLLPAKSDAGQSCMWLFLEFAYIGDGWLVLEGAAIAEVLTLHQNLAQNRTLHPALPGRPHLLSLFFRIWLEQILCLASTSTPESHWDMEMLNFSLNLNYPHSNIEYFISSNMRQFN